MTDSADDIIPSGAIEASSSAPASQTGSVDDVIPTEATSGKPTKIIAAKPKGPKTFAERTSDAFDESLKAMGITPAGLSTSMGLGAAGQIAGGLSGLARIGYDYLTGQGGGQTDVNAANTVNQVQAPFQAAAQKVVNPTLAAGMASDWNPLNWIGVGARKAGETAQSLGASPMGATAIETGINAIPYALGMGAESKLPSGEWKAPLKTPETTAGGSVGAAATEGVVPQEHLVAPVEGGLPEAAHENRAAVLNRVGINNARQSAITGDAKSAAVDYQLSKIDDPAGRAAAAQFENEKNALANHTENMIGDVGGTVGMDEGDLMRRGSTIASAFDSLKQYYKDQTSELYKEADQRGGGAPITYLSSVDRLLNNSRFKNAMGAKNQRGFVDAIQSELANFRGDNPNGFNAQTAEQFRQFLNETWTPENQNAVRQLKAAVDQDVLSAAGEDIYQKARALHQEKMQTLENPNGIKQLFDVDPNTPINRKTGLEQIPNKMLSLSTEQFANILDTLKNMPEAVQPDAQAAISEIKGHLLNGILNKGVETSRGVPSATWGTDRVSTFMRNNAEKLRIAFQDDPEIRQKLEDLHHAGQIIRAPQNYPGAYAQATNLIKRGVIAKALPSVAASGGATAGAATGIPGAAALGAIVGENLGQRGASAMTESAALKDWQKRIRSTETNEGNK